MSKTKDVGKVFKTIWKIIRNIITIILIIISLIIIIQRVSNNEHSFLGYRIFRVQTGSMIPKYQIGDVLLVKETKFEKLQVGDDVTYKGNDGSFSGLTVTHQIIDIEEVDGEAVIHTKGIANNLEDPTISPDQIIGVVQTRLEILTYITSLLNNAYIFYFCAIIPLTIYAFFTIIKGGSRNKYKKYKKIKEEAEENNKQEEK